jgi:hypothetical protein
LESVLHDLPTEGTVVLEFSTNLAHWEPCLTNPAAPHAILRRGTYPADTDRRFYRAVVK